MKVLIANGAHLGDVVLATSVLPVVKKRYPEAEIGFLVGSWSRCVVEDHPMVDRVHIVDHWRLNRGNGLGYLRTRRQALEEIRQYDIAIDLYGYFPNSSVVLWQAGIPIRYGFGSRLYTHRVPWRREPMLQAYQRLLDSEPLIPSLPYEKSQGNYFIFHTEADDRSKEWDRFRWHALAKQYPDREILFTSRDKGLSWQQLIDVVAGAAHVVTVDTVVAHIAHAVGTACVTVHRGKGDPLIWVHGRRVSNIPRLGEHA